MPRRAPQLDEFFERFERGFERGFEGAPLPDGGFRFDLGGGPILGVSVDQALVVTAVAPSSPAAAAGVEVGDAIRSVDGASVATFPELRAALTAVEPGAIYVLGVVRGDAAVDLEVERPRSLARDALPGDIAPERLRGLLEGLRSGRLSLEDVPPELRDFLSEQLERFPAPAEPQRG